LAVSLDEMMNEFRIASRELFNGYFRAAGATRYDERSWQLEQRFRAVQAVLFQKMVAERAAIDMMEYGYLQPQISVTRRAGEFGPLMLNRDVASGYWDHPVKEFTKDVRFAFIDFFDFGALEYCDNRYVRVRVTHWPRRADLVGKRALIETQYVRFKAVAKRGSGH